MKTFDPEETSACGISRFSSLVPSWVDNPSRKQSYFADNKDRNFPPRKKIGKEKITICEVFVPN